MSEEEEKIYINRQSSKPKFNHVAMKIRIATSLKLEFLRDTGDMRVSRERGMHNKHLQETKIWLQILGRRNVQHIPEIVLIGTDPN